MVRVFVKQGAFTPRWHGPYEVKAIWQQLCGHNCEGETAMVPHVSVQIIQKYSE